MKSSYQINIDFYETMRQADKLEEVADEMRNLAEQSFEDTLENIAANWKGENANLYLNKGSIVKKNIAKDAKKLKQIADEIRRRARFIREKEEQALRIAKERTY